MEIVRTHLYDCWLTTYTARQLRHHIVWRYLLVAPSTLVFHAVGRRASYLFLGPGHARATTAAAPMNLLRPASLPLPASLPPAIQRRHDFLLHRASLLFPLCRALHIHCRSYLRVVSYDLPERFLIETTDVSYRYCNKRHPRTINFVCHLSDDALFQLRLSWWRFGVRIRRWRLVGAHFDDVRILATNISYRRTYSTDVRILLTYVCYRRRDSATTYVFSWRTYCGNVRILATYVFSRHTYSTDVRIFLTYAFYRRTYFPDVRIVATTYFGDVRIISTYVFYGRTWCDDVRILVTYVLWRWRIRDNAFGERWIPNTHNTLDAGSGWRRSTRTHFLSGLRLVPKLQWHCAIYICDVSWIKLQLTCIYKHLSFLMSIVQKDINEFLAELGWWYTLLLFFLRDVKHYRNIIVHCRTFANIRAHSREHCNRLRWRS